MHNQKTKNSLGGTLFLSLAALGVVYGDIGTSPLYAINQIFFGSSNKFLKTTEILGAISLVVWSLSIVIAFKYIFLVLKADNDGEGGVFALYGLLDNLKKRSLGLIIALLIIAAGLLFGDGVITPAISVISSVEGLKIATPALTPYIVPITIVILTGLFSFQSRGTYRVGIVFGPIIVLWFVSIAFLGIQQIIRVPEILQALNPSYGVQFLTHHQLFTILVTLGAVMLVITGGEALYADMGHFGRLPIRLSWFSIVFPALILNYLGQGAYLMSGAKVMEGNLFYSMTPHWALFPMVLISTFATIIASQALISGAFSLATQAVSLGLFPYLKVIHTHHEHEGQIYVPFINWMLYLGCILLVVFFQSSDRLASAYGLAVSGVMLATSLSMTFVSHYYWKWGWIRTLLLFIPLSIIDITFLVSNSLKFVQGGYIPLFVGISLLVIMETWQWGKRKIIRALNAYPRITMSELVAIKEKQKDSIPRSEIIMSTDPISSKQNKIPILKQLYFERHGLLPKNIIFITVVFKKIPHIHHNRYIVRKFYENPTKGAVISVVINFGFMEEPNVEPMLEELANHKEINIKGDPKSWNIHILYEKTRINQNANVIDIIRFKLFRFLQRNTERADNYLELGQTHPLSIDIIPVRIN